MNVRSCELPWPKSERFCVNASLPVSLVLVEAEHNADCERLLAKPRPGWMWTSRGEAKF